MKEAAVLRLESSEGRRKNRSPLANSNRVEMLCLFCCNQ